jgi:small subunit ribosomal protein S8e
MGISRDSRHKRRETGGKRSGYRKKRNFEKGRPPAETKLGTQRVHLVRGRGGNMKFRAMRLESGNFSWRSEAVAKKVRILDVVYNSSNNELVRTKTLVKGCVVQIDASPFKTWYESHYGMEVGKKRKDADGNLIIETKDDKKRSKHLAKKIAARDSTLLPNLGGQFGSGRLLAVLSSRPGQSGRADGYILEGPELDYYIKQSQRKRK